MHTHLGWLFDHRGLFHRFEPRLGLQLSRLRLLRLIVHFSPLRSPIIVSDEDSDVT